MAHGSLRSLEKEGVCIEDLGAQMCTVAVQADARSEHAVVPYNGGMHNGDYNNIGL